MSKKLRWGNGEWITGGSPYIGEPRGTSSHIGTEYNDRQNIKSGLKQSGITFGELASEYDIDPEILRYALRNREVEIDSDETPLYVRDVEFIRSTFPLKMKPEAKAKLLEEWAILYKRIQTERLDHDILQEGCRLEAMENNQLEGLFDSSALIDEAKRNLRNLELRRKSVTE
jgi:hypothetical protein